MYKLIIEDDEGKTTVVPLIRDEITIGRKEGNTIRLTERNVSRKHARLLKVNGAIYIEDLQSYNGIKVNGERIGGRAPIAEGDRVQIGDYQLALKLDRSAAVEEPRGEEKTTPFIKEPGPEPARSTAMVEAPRISSPGAPAAPAATAAGQAAPAAERPARLVVVSSNFAGKEFRLEKNEMVIGRTSGDNDIVIDHRSISRHHAKILRDGGRYQVQDLGSANGVRVNGEEYGKVELRKGDLLDLGHVRLRFVAPAEDFVFARDAKVVDVVEEAEKKGKGLLIGGIAGGIAVVGAIVAVVVLRGGSGGPGSDKGGGGSTAEINVTVERLIKEKNWAGAIAEADKGLQINPKDDLLAEKKAKAELNQRNQPVYEAYDKAVKSGDTETAVMKYQEIAESSVYHAEAQGNWNVVKKGYINDQLGKARELSDANRCDDAKKHVEAVLMVDDANTAAQDIARKCGQPTVAPKPVRPPAGGTKPPRPPTTPKPVVETPKPVVETPKPVVETPPPSKGGDIEGLLQDSQTAYVQGKYREAIDLSRKILKIDSNNAKAWRTIGASHCFLKEETEARQAWNKLKPMDRQFLRYVCQRNSINLE